MCVSEVVRQKKIDRLRGRRRDKIRFLLVTSGCPSCTRSRHRCLSDGGRKCGARRGSQVSVQSRTSLGTSDDRFAIPNISRNDPRTSK